MKALNDHRLCGDEYVAVCTQNRPDAADSSRQKPDCGIYLTTEEPRNKRTDWGTLRMSIEFKRRPVQDDPFNDKKAVYGEFEAIADKREDNRGQIISYTSELFLRQHRCFAYSLIVFGHFVRIIRWDRSGALVTEKINYVKEPHKLCSFLWRWSHYSDEQQGLDPTVTLVEKNSDDYKRMWKAADAELPYGDYVRQYFRRSLEPKDDWPCWKIVVNDLPEDPPRNDEDDDSDSSQGTGSSSTVDVTTQSERFFLVCKPHFEERSVVGRGTRGYVALDCKTGDFVFLKDAWRVDMEGIESEGDVLLELHANGVRNIPTVVCHGDVRGQRTLTDTLWERPAKAPLGLSNPLKPHRHYRLVEKEVGRPLDDFTTGRDLLQRVLDCLVGELNYDMPSVFQRLCYVVAHEDAMEKAGILHRDISGGNMLIVDLKTDDGKIERSGLLNDWELSKRIPRSDSRDIQSSARQPDRTVSH